MNQNYDNVATLYDQGKLNWETDAINALLCSGAAFDASAKTVADLAGQRLGTQRINGRHIIDDLWMGLPVVFQTVPAGPLYQVIVVQDIGNGNPNLLAFSDANADGSPITVQHTGTLIIRPVLPDVEVPPERPPTIGVWLQLAA